MSSSTLRASFVAPRKQLLAALAVASAGAAVPSRRCPAPLQCLVKLSINGHVRLQSATRDGVTVTDSPHDEKDGDCAVLVEPKRLTAALKASKAASVSVAVDTEANRLTLDGGAATLPTESDTLALPHGHCWTAGAPALVVTTTAESLRRAIAGSVYATDVESTRYALGGVCLVVEPDGRVTFTATDSRRLAVIELTDASVTDNRSDEQRADRNSSLVIPASALVRLAKAIKAADDGAVLTLEFGERTRFAEVTEKYATDPKSPGTLDAERTYIRETKSESVVITCPNLDLTIESSLVEGRFPRYRDVIPSPAQHDMRHFTFLAGELADACAAAMVVTDSESRGVDFVVGASDSVTLWAMNTSGGRAAVPVRFIAAEWSAGAVTITLDPAFVVDFCRSRDKKEPIVLSVIDHEKPAVFRPASDALGECVYVVMPLARNRKV